MDQGFVWPCSLCAGIAFGLFALGFLAQVLLGRREIPRWIRWLFDACCVVILLGIGLRPFLGVGGDDVANVVGQAISALVTLIAVDVLVRAGGAFARGLFADRGAGDNAV